MSKTYKEATGGRDINKFAAMTARSVKFHDKRQERGGARNQMASFLDQYEEEQENEEQVSDL